VARLPDAKEITTIVSLLASLAMAMGYGAENKRANGNRDANYSGREALVVCERRVDRFLEHMDEDH